ncbi:hypothetical protein DQ04_13361000 [Trypanosoma grayi]|uniref:hypothetical protein n=1 Tax=Trypanosoma grayi TaxID=71804 RepID=UPI0004F44A88|nr:hypothetical protein DQ04_13361000 [Trypanosoma grayi]KEG06554.1 hypothetical protein DQ04_13361000 [Trypanosoma grayi]
MCVSSFSLRACGSVYREGSGDAPRCVGVGSWAVLHVLVRDGCAAGASGEDVVRAVRCQAVALLPLLFLAVVLIQVPRSMREASRHLALMSGIQAATLFCRMKSLQEKAKVPMCTPEGMTVMKMKRVEIVTLEPQLLRGPTEDKR